MLELCCAASSPTIRRLAIAAALVASSSGSSLSQTMPACDDPVMIKGVETSYKFSDAQMGGTFQAIKDVKETGNGKAIKNFHKYESATAHIDDVRYCEGLAVLGGGETDKVYFRIPHMVDGEKHTFKPDICSTRLYSFLGECKDFKP